MGTALLGIGVFIQLETESDERISGLGLDSFLSNPAIILIIFGVLLFLLGFCGCFGALFEISYLLIFVSPSSTSLFNRHSLGLAQYGEAIL